MRLQDKVAIVTGGARGIGRAIVDRYAAEGARVCVADVNLGEAEETAARAGKGAFAVAFDAASQDSIGALVAKVIEAAGGIDILVNNAGVFAMAPLEEVTREQWQKVFAVNVEGVVFTMQAVAREMIRQGRGGKIINLASQAGRRGEALVLTYCASKAAVISITQSAGLRLIKYGINVNGIAPGVVDTPMWDFVDREFARYENRAIGETRAMVGRLVPFGRMGKPEDFGGIAVFLASGDSDYVVAQTYGVDGGNWLA
ncbi:MAG: L-iditol 2-dehydrogenase [Methylobacteriaceae bacterium]|nr:L-iditol 2-dehydrogenase [Methylobacteriaceae bacterium]MBV9704142.1 L-iditol 2-dehydrogenase [Methylobacteriaceae bacterium]